MKICSNVQKLVSIKHSTQAQHIMIIPIWLKMFLWGKDTFIKYKGAENLPPLPLLTTFITSCCGLRTCDRATMDVKGALQDNTWNDSPLVAFYLKWLGEQSVQVPPAMRIKQSGQSFVFMDGDDWKNSTQLVQLYLTGVQQWDYCALVWVHVS